MVPAPPVTIVSFGGGGLASGTGSWMRWPPVPLSKRSAQYDQPLSYKTVSISKFSHRIDKFDEIHGLSDLLYMEGSSKDAFA
jgi:hypothetical protein